MDDDAPYDDGYPRGPFDERLIGPPPDSWYWPPGAVQVVLQPEELELLNGVLAEARARKQEQQRRENEQRGRELLAALEAMTQRPVPANANLFAKLFSQ